MTLIVSLANWAEWPYIYIFREKSIECRTEFRQLTQSLSLVLLLGLIHLCHVSHQSAPDSIECPTLSTGLYGESHQIVGFLFCLALQCQ